MHCRRMQDLGMATRAIHGGQCPDERECKSVVTPIVMSVTYQQNEPGSQRGCINSVKCNPTRQSLEECLACMEKCKHCLVMPSGLCAMQMMMQMCMKSGDHMLMCDDMDAMTIKLMRECISKMGISWDMVDCCNLGELEKAMKPNTRMILLETPSNPMMKICDIEGICKLARKMQKGTRMDQRIMVCVDNTMMTPMLQCPLELGADMCCYTLTRYMGGHQDCMMGALTMNDDEMEKCLREMQECMGMIPSPMDCMLMERSLKTLCLRMEQHQKNAMMIAKAMEKNPMIEKVLYPGLTSHPQHDLAMRQMKGMGGMMCMILKGNADMCKKMMKSCKLWIIGENYGGCESMICMPTCMTHMSLQKEQRMRVGMADNCIRLSCGLEDCKDLIEDLEQALKNCKN
ncbi:CTH.2 family protein [Megaselia abdita]